MEKKWTVAELKIELFKRGAKTTGRKKELLERLEAYDRNNDFANTVQLDLPSPSPMPDWPSITNFRTLVQADQGEIPQIQQAHIDQYVIVRQAGDSASNADNSSMNKGRKVSEDSVAAISLYQPFSDTHARDRSVGGVVSHRQSDESVRHGQHVEGGGDHGQTVGGGSHRGCVDGDSSRCGQSVGGSGGGRGQGIGGGGGGRGREQGVDSGHGHRPIVDGGVDSRGREQRVDNDGGSIGESNKRSKEGDSGHGQSVEGSGGHKRSVEGSGLRQRTKGGGQGQGEEVGVHGQPAECGGHRQRAKVSNHGQRAKDISNSIQDDGNSSADPQSNLKEKGTQSANKGEHLLPDSLSPVAPQEKSFFTGIVNAAMKKSLSYNIRLIVLETGEVLNSDCDCPAGVGPHATCKHVVAALLVLSEFALTGNLRVSKSCIEELQTFSRPKRLHAGSPMKADQLGKVKCNDPRPDKLVNWTGYQDHFNQATINYCAFSGRNVTWKHLIPQKTADLQAASEDHSYLAEPFTHL